MKSEIKKRMPAMMATTAIIFFICLPASLNVFKSNSTLQVYI